MKERERTKAPTFLPVPHPAQEVLSQGRQMLSMWREVQNDFFMQFKVPWKLVPTSASPLQVHLDLLPCTKCYSYL